MKKILSFLAVASIITSSFALTNKELTDFCVRNAAGTACEVITNKKMSTGTPNFLHYPFGPSQWDGTHSGCTSASPTTDCIVPIRLIDN